MKKVTLFLFMFAISGYLLAQVPVISVRFANPTLNCNQLTYCVDVEFQSNTPDKRLFGMNTRFFFDYSVLEFNSFSNFQPGYGPMNPNPPMISTGGNASGSQLFNLFGPATYINGAVQLNNPSSPPIYISVNDWTRIFTVCFTVKNPEIFASGDFSPSLIWDLESNPLNGGFLPGSDGVVVTLVGVPPMESAPATENVIQFNWQYSATTSAPYGSPVVTNNIAPCLIMVANNDDFTPNTISSFEGGVAGNVLQNDLVNGFQPNPTQISLSIVNNGGLNGASLTFDGNLSVPAVTPAGNYTLIYRIGEYGNTDNFKDAQVLVHVADPQLQCPVSLVICFNQEPIQLGGAVPGGGVYSGNGVMNGVFNPVVAGIGTHFLTYCAVNPFTNQQLCCDFTIQVTDGQQLMLASGWSGISSYIMPANPTMSAVLSPAGQSVNLAYNLSGIYWPEMGINTLNEWNPYSGYITKTTTELALPICGSSLANTSFPMSAGWNIMPVLSASPYNAQDLFSGLNLLVAKEVAGTGVYWPAFNINTIGNLQPGKAYVINLTTPGVIDFSQQQKNSSTAAPENIGALNTPWNAVNFTPSSHLVAFNLSDNPLKVGDIIGGFTQDGLCAGLTEVKNTTQPFAISLHGNDIYSAEIDGFADGEIITFAVYRPSTGELYDLILSYNPSLNDGFFANNGLSEVNSLKLSSTGMVIIDSDQLLVYPNPTHGIFTVNGLAGETNIKVYNAYGKEVTKAKAMLPQTFDLTGLARGVYMIRISVDQKMYFRKLIIN